MNTQYLRPTPICWCAYTFLLFFVVFTEFTDDVATFAFVKKIIGIAELKSTCI